MVKKSIVHTDVGVSLEPMETSSTSFISGSCVYVDISGVLKVTCLGLRKFLVPFFVEYIFLQNISFILSKIISTLINIYYDK